MKRKGVGNAKLRKAILTCFIHKGVITGAELQKAYSEGIKNPEETIAMALEISKKAREKHLASIAK